MSVKTDLEKALKDAILSRNKTERDAIRMALSSIKQLEIDSGKVLTEQETFSVLQKEIKTKEETISEAKNADRMEMIPPIEAEIKVLKKFLPQEFGDEELRALIKEVIAEVNAEGMKDMGNVMKTTIARVAGRATNDRISRVVRELL